MNKKSDIIKIIRKLNNLQARLDAEGIQITVIDGVLSVVCKNFEGKTLPDWVKTEINIWGGSNED